MKKVILILAATLSLTFFSLNAMAGSENYPPLNQVSYQFSAEQWATTKTAKVVVGVSAALTSSQLGQIHSQIMGKLNKIASTAWHITRFDRTKSQTGLEQLNAQAEARISESALANLRAKAKSVSKPGENYKIIAIQFTPGMAEIEATRAQLRDKLYLEASRELARLNKVYPNQHYSLHAIRFGVRSMPVAQMMRANTMFMAKRVTGSASSESAAMAVSNKIIMTATVVLASSSRDKKLKDE